MDTPEFTSEVVITRYIIKLVPSVVQELLKHGHQDKFVSIMSLVANKSFPLENIAFLLFLDFSDEV